MAKKKEKDVLGLSIVAAAPKPGTELVPFGGRKLTREERRITDELHKQVLVLEGTAQKTAFSQAKITEIHMHGAVMFEETVAFIASVKEESRGTDYQTYVDQFSRRQIESLARHLLGVTEVGAMAISYEVNRSLYPPPEQRGFLQRLFGE